MGTASSSKNKGVKPEDPPLRWEILPRDLDSFSLELRRDSGPSAAESGKTYKLVVDAGSAGREEYEAVTLESGRNNIATKVNAASKLIKIEETGASLPDE
jgi:hypothetical protein